jgi:hypothetical protein
MAAVVGRSTGSLDMFPIPRLSNQVVNEWAEELAAVTGRSKEQLVANPEGIDFPGGTLRVELMDSSVVEFRWAFHVVSERNRAIAVFTEHCGHHVFPYHEARVFRDGQLVYEQKHV